MVDCPCLLRTARGFIFGDMRTKSGKLVSAYKGEKTLTRYEEVHESISTEALAAWVESIDFSIVRFVDWTICISSSSVV